MNPAILIAAIDGCLTALEKLWPLLAEATSKGEVTVEQQEELAKRVKSLRAGGEGFTGPEWGVSEPSE